MKIAALGAGHIGSTVGRLWQAAGHDVTFAARDPAGPWALAAELGDRTRAAAGDARALAERIRAGDPRW